MDRGGAVAAGAWASIIEVTDGDLPQGPLAVVGECPHMCPAQERAQRERIRDLSVFERVDGNAGRTSPSLAVKKFCRTISSAHVQSSDIRPLPVLKVTMDHLLQILDSSQLPFEAVHDFIFDRTRAIRQDLSIQNIVNLEAIQIYENVVKFHIISHQRLGRCADKSGISSLWYLNMEQLMKCLLSLFTMYHSVHQSESHSKSEAEFYSFFPLLHLGSNVQKMGVSLSLWYRKLPSSIFRSRELCFARTLLRCSHLGNYKLFFCELAAEATDMQLSLVEPFLNEVRSKALMYINYSGYKLHCYPLDQLAKTLLIKDSELEALCKSCGLETITDESGAKLLPPKQTTLCLPNSALQSYKLSITT